ncbi:MAG: class I SAM-dependent methyltransferase [Anaerovoracaceae bacterium]|nr:class I SAM-dependent methyltransferase [Clostridiales bacterium]
MGKKGLFDKIAFPYSWFYSYQVSMFGDTLSRSKDVFNFSDYRTVLDVGSGTGAFCAVLKEMGLSVTGTDMSLEMIKVAKKKNPSIEFVHSDATVGLPFPDKSFDIVMASYVAHGINKEERRELYTQMGRVAKEWVVIYDYNQKRSPLTSLVEWMEGGDYFNFIRHGRKEMEECRKEMELCFSEVKVFDIGKRTALYLLKPRA